MCMCACPFAAVLSINGPVFHQGMHSFAFGVFDWEQHSKVRRPASAAICESDFAVVVVPFPQISGASLPYWLLPVITQGVR